MDLEQYLISSQKKRSDMIKAAEGYLKSNATPNFFRSHTLDEHHEVHLGPTPQKLKFFEEEVNHQLKKIFTPGLTEPISASKLFPSGTIDEIIKKAYVSLSPPPKKKQLIILPKNLYVTKISVPKTVIKNKHFSHSPDCRTDLTSSSCRTEDKKSFQVKKLLKKDLLLPVLTTIGTHEYRSKIYKYK